MARTGTCELCIFKQHTKKERRAVKHQVAPQDPSYVLKLCALARPLRGLSWLAMSTTLRWPLRYTSQVQPLPKRAAPAALTAEIIAFQLPKSRTTAWYSLLELDGCVVSELFGGAMICGRRTSKVARLASVQGPGCSEPKPCQAGRPAIADEARLTLQKSAWFHAPPPLFLIVVSRVRGTPRRPVPTWKAGSSRA